MSTSTIVTEARKWIDGLSAPGGLAGSWRLFVLEKSDRVRPDGTVVQVPLKIRRFAQGCPWALLHEAMKYLCESAPYTGLIYNGLVLDGTYRPTRTRWVRDDNVTVDKNRADNTYTLIQDLVDSDNPAYAVGSGGSCSEEVVTEWHWDASSVEDVPAPGQGVSYSIQSVGRNEDGSFNYALVKRTAVTQHMMSVATECGAYETVYVETWDNVYGSAPAFVDNLGNAVSVPSVCGTPNGTVVELAVQENQDCTFRITATTKVAKNVQTEKSSQKTIFEHDASTVTRADGSALPEAPAASGGIVVTRKSELRADGAYDNTEQVKTEREVLSSTKTVTVTRRGRRVTVVDTNQAAPASTGNLPIGSEVKVEKTPGGLYTNTCSEWEKGDPVRAGEKCSLNLMKHVDEATTAGADMPAPGDHVSGGGVGGHVITRVTTVGDEGDVTQVLTDEQERSVLAQRETWRVGLYGVIHSVTDMQVSTPGTAPSYSRVNVGSSVENEKTPGGLVNVTRTSIDRTGLPINAGDGCSRTVFEHSDSTSTNRPDGGFAGHAPPAGGGHYYENTTRLNDDGSSTVVERDTQELPVSSAIVSVAKTLHGVRRRTVHRNQTSRAVTTGLRIGDSVTSEMTKGGRFDQTIETFAEESVGGIGSECKQHALEHGHTSLSNQVSKPAEEISAAVGQVKERVLRLTEHGTWDVTDTVRTSKVGEASISAGTPLRTVVRVNKRNAETLVASPGGVNVEVSASSSKNEFGRYDGTIETTTFHPAAASASGGAKLAGTVVKVDRNTTTAAPSDSPAVNKDVSVSLSINEHGSYDRTVHVTTYSPRTGALAGKGAVKAHVDVATYNNAMSAAISEAPAVNRDVDVSISQNEHGSYDKSVRVTRYDPRSASALAKGADKAKVDVYTWNNDTSSAVSQAPAVNKSVDVSISQNEHGSYDKSARVVTYQKRHAQANGVGSVGAKVNVITDNHDPAPAIGQSPGKNKDVEVSISQNEHGSYDKTVRVIEYERQGDTKTIYNPLYDETTSVYANDENAPDGTAPDGQMISTSFSPNQHGTYSTNKTVRTAKQKESTVVHWADTFYDHYKKVYRNYNAPDTPGSYSNGGDSLTPTESSCSFQINDYGLFDGSWEVKTARIGDSWLFFKSTTETIISDDVSWPDDAGGVWTKRTTTKIPVRYYVTRNITQVYNALADGFTYNGRSGRVVCSLGAGLMLVAKYDEPGKTRADFTRIQI